MDSQAGRETFFQSFIGKSEKEWRDVVAPNSLPGGPLGSGGGRKVSEKGRGVAP